MADVGTTDPDVYRDRMARAVEAMSANGIDRLFVGPSADLRYLTGYDAHVSERLNLLSLQTTAAPFLVVPTLEAPNAKSAAGSAYVDIHTWDDHESPIDLVAQHVGRANNDTIGVSEQLFSGFLLKLQAVLPDASWISAQDVMRSLRVVKDAREIELLAEAARRTDEAWREFVKGPPLSGLTETQAMERLMGMTTKRGLVTSFGICASGPNSAAPHYSTSDRVIQQGDVIIFDWGGSIEGYHSDVTRTVVVGEPSDEYRRVHEIVKQANELMFATVEPGVSCQDLDKVAREFISEQGYGDHFIHRVGHGLGLDVHEDPYLVDGNDTLLDPGMVFSDEPGIYLEGQFGVRIEDSVVCTKDGGRKLNHASREITLME